MNKSFRTLSRMSPMFYKRTSGSNYTCLIQYIHNAQNPCLDAPKAISQPHGINFSKVSTDSVIQELQMYKEPEKIMEIIQMNYGTMDLRRALTALICLHAICKNANDIQYVANSKEYAFLCKSLHKNIRSMTAQEAVRSLDLILYFDTGSRFSKTILVQSLLQLIRSSINDLNIQSVLTLHYALLKVSSTPLSTALMQALPLIFDIRIGIELDRTNIEFMTNAVSYAVSTKCSKTTMNTLLEAINDYGVNISPSIAYRLLRDLSVLHHIYASNSLYSEIISNTQKVLITNGSILNINKILILISKMVLSTQRSKTENDADNRSTDVYNDALLDECINWLLAKQINLVDSAKVLRCLNKLVHINVRFLDYITAKFYMEDFGSPTHATYTPAALCIISAVAKADYKPVFWDNIEKPLINNVVKFCKEHQDKRIALNYSIYLATLNYYDPELLESVFSQPLEAVKPSRLLLLYQCVKVFYPEYSGPFPDESIFKNINNSVEKISVKYAIEQGLGGSQYVLHGLTTKLGHFIDHAVAMRKGGYPIAIRNENNDTDAESLTDINTLQVSPDSQIILVVNINGKGYARNCQRLKGSMSLYVRTLEAVTGYNVVIINSTMWENLLDHEKIPYLMQAIKLKCKDIAWE